MAFRLDVLWSDQLPVRLETNSGDDVEIMSLGQVRSQEAREEASNLDHPKFSNFLSKNQMIF